MRITANSQWEVSRGRRSKYEASPRKQTNGSAESFKVAAEDAACSHILFAACHGKSCSGTSSKYPTASELVPSIYRGIMIDFRLTY